MSQCASRRLLGAFAGLAAIGALSGCAAFPEYGSDAGYGFGNSYYSPGYAYSSSIGAGFGWGGFGGGGFGWGGDGDFDGD